MSFIHNTLHLYKNDFKAFRDSANLLLLHYLSWTPLIPYLYLMFNRVVSEHWELALVGVSRFVSVVLLSIVLVKHGLIKSAKYSVWYFKFLRLVGKVLLLYALLSNNPDLALYSGVASLILIITTEQYFISNTKYLMFMRYGLQNRARLLIFNHNVFDFLVITTSLITGLFMISYNIILVWSIVVDVLFLVYLYKNFDDYKIQAEKNLHSKVGKSELFIILSMMLMTSSLALAFYTKAFAIQEVNPRLVGIFYSVCGITSLFIIGHAGKYLTRFNTINRDSFITSSISALVIILLTLNKYTALGIYLIVFPVIITVRTGLLHYLYKIDGEKTTWNYLVVSEYFWAVSSLVMIPLGLLKVNLTTLHFTIGALVGLSALVLLPVLKIKQD